MTRNELTPLIYILFAAFFFLTFFVPDDALATEPSRSDFSRYNPVYQFSAIFPEGWQVEYVPAIQAINIYDPVASGNTREKSQIFIRHFTAKTFLTLPSVNVIKREPTKVKGYEAVRYEIEKKKGVPPFPQQPSWRNGPHRLIDVRFRKSNPSTFYVFSYNPSLGENIFEDFISSLHFYNDAQSFGAPLGFPSQRATKKPFGIKVSPTNSPVQPERFSGYHTGTDFEIFEQEEEDKGPVLVRAICGGRFRVKQKASGYGGVAVQECVLGNMPITVIYGHLKLDSISTKKGAYLAPGDQIGLLGQGGTAEAGGERKHLHLGIKKGTKIDIRGYVPRERDLLQWLDPCSLVCK